MTGKDKKLELQERELANVSGGEELETIPIEDISDQLNVKIGPMTAFSSGPAKGPANEPGTGYYQDNSNNSGAQQNTQNGDCENTGGMNVKKK
ncbi:MAG: hypothetical protein IIZ87_05165 [Selenomonas sp.]|nr:hypothetical protein [Selenomonas sp.]MBQ1920430.1 hypothetical protein [Selenomonas sp.]